MKKRASKVTVYNTQKDLPISITKCKKTILKLLDLLSIATNEVIIHFVTEKKICQLHQLLFNDPSPTDCISVPIDPPCKKRDYHLLGEIFICTKIAKKYAYEYHLNWREEVTRYIIHGMLHLIGYNDIRLKDRYKMKIKEDELVAQFATEANFSC